MFNFTFYKGLKKGILWVRIILFSQLWCKILIVIICSGLNIYCSLYDSIRCFNSMLSNNSFQLFLILKISKKFCWFNMRNVSGITNL